MTDINPGFVSTAQQAPYPLNAAPVVRCPVCNRVLGQGDFDVLIVRCKSCKSWVMIRKKAG